MKETEPLVNVFCNEFIPDEIITDLNELAEKSSFKLQINKKKSEPMAGLEWFLQTSLFLYFIKPYTDAFLQEMGKDNYHSIKQLIITSAQKLIGKNKIINIRVVTSSNAKSKVNGQYSVSFSALFQITEKDRIKFLFDDSLSIEELTDYATKIENFIINNKTETIMNIIRESGEWHMMNTSFYSYNKKTKELMILDPLEGKRKLPPR